MLSIRFSNRFETLRDALTLNLGAASGSVFDAPQVVVPSSAVRRALSLAIADRHGICANVEFVYLAAWLWRQIGRVVESVAGESPFAARVLAWAVYELLGDSSWTGRFARLSHYLKDAAPLRRWDLASEIAVVLEQYITYRQDWLTAWSSGERVDFKPASASGADHDWQAELWRRLLARLGSNQEHPANRFFRLLKASQAVGAPSADLPASVHVFCLPAVPPLYLDVLIGLGQWIDVRIYVLNPCREYWFDIVEPKRLSHLIVRREAAHRETGNRLLASWGNQTRGQIELLLDRSGDAPIDDSGYHDDQPDTLLGRVQRSILDLEDLAPASLAGLDDRSIEVHVCHSLTRELEVLQDQLLALLSGPTPPALADILVVTPDLEAAAPLIDAVFGNVPAERVLPYRVSGRGRSTVNAAARALLAILGVLPSRFAASALIDLLQQPIIGRRFRIGSDELENIEDWMQDSGIRWGIDAEHRREQGLPPEQRFTVEDGLHRLFLGYALPERVAAPSQGRVPAGNPEGSRALDLGVFGHFCQLLTELRIDFRRARSADGWLASLMGVLETFMLPVGDELDDLGEVSDAIREVHADMVRGGAAMDVPLAVVAAALDAILGESAHGGVPTGAITFTSMTSLRNLPFAVICVIGLDDGVFPQISRPTEFDLMAGSPRRGDRQRRTDDRNLFLDLLLAARRRLYLSYTGRSEHDNSIVPASVVVAELIETLLPAMADDPNDPASLAQARRRLVLEHPLQAYSWMYFTAGGDPRLVSFNRELRDALRDSILEDANHAAPVLPVAAHESDDQKRGDDEQRGDDEEPSAAATEPFFTAPLSPVGAEWRTVSLDQLLRFFRNPCRFLLRDRLGMALYREGRSQSDDEPFLPDFDARAALAERLLPQAMLISSDRELESLAQAGIEYPPGVMGAVLLREELATLRHFAHSVRDATLPDRLAPIDVEHEFDLDGELWRLSTVLTGVRPAGLVLHRYDDTRATDYLTGWLTHLVLCAAAPSGSTSHTRWISRDGDYVLEPCSEALAILQGLLTLYRKGLHEPLHFFPKSAWVYLESGRQLNKARTKWRPIYEGARGECDHAAYQLAWRGRADPIDADFVACVDTVFGKLRTYLRDDRLKVFW